MGKWVSSQAITLKKLAREVVEVEVVIPQLLQHMKRPLISARYD